MKSPSRALAVSRENAYEATKFTFVMPRTGLAFCDVSFTCSALYADRPIGKSIWFAPTLALIPGKAAPVSGVRPVGELRGYPGNRSQNQGRALQSQR